MRDRIAFSGWFFVMLALMVLLLPANWLICCIVAAAVHELCHLTAIYLCTGIWQSVRLFSGKAQIMLPELPWWKELLCALAGPVGGFVLWPGYPQFPLLAVCGLVQSIYNLLPIYPLDGGRALRCLCDGLLRPAVSAYICEFVGAMVKGLLLAFGLFALVSLDLGILPLIIALGILFKTRKCPCNQNRLAVQ